MPKTAPRQGTERWYNRAVDALLTREAQAEIEAVRAARWAPSTWGVALGHRRGPCVVVEKVFPVGCPPSRPSATLYEKLDRIWPGRIVGLFAVRPNRAFRQAVLGPLWYGKLVLDLGAAPRRDEVRAFVVELGRKFFLEPVQLTPDRERRGDG